MRVSISITGDVQVERKLLRLGDRAANASVVFSQIADKLMDWTDEQFRSEGARASGGWEELAPSTVRAKGHEGILVDTGDLYNALVNRGDANQILDINDDEMRYGADLDYLIYHQRGTDRMPQRRPIEFTEFDRREIVRDLQAFIMTGRVQ